MRDVAYIFLGSLLADVALWLVLGWPLSPGVVFSFTMGAFALAWARSGD